MLTYITLNGKVIDISNLSISANYLLSEMRSACENNVHDSWLGFQNTWARQVELLAKDEFGDDWNNHPIYKIQLYLTGYVGVKNGELGGDIRELSDLFQD